MNFQIEDKGNYKHLIMQSDRLDVLSVPKLKAELLFQIREQGNKNIVLDISRCSFCDASGLSAIQAMHCMCEKEDGILIVTGIQTNIKKLINICKLDQVLTIVNDPDEVETLLQRKTENELTGSTSCTN